MSTTLDQYREAKQNWMKLRNQAKKELLARFHELAAELQQVQRELAEDFGEKVALPPAKAKKPVKKAAGGSAPEPAPAPAAPAKSSPEITALQKKLQGQRKKLEELQAAGKPTRAVEDRIYEIEDALRLAHGPLA